ncbi:uncharacterized protein LOC116614139 [Nematostella vectensis]|uniref:uncharacterized protein LOC116614139 n=1 Tax=Nematostella vectensis TaxID=45351 RepID=UPI0020778F16|nr:uncharacterized protein LOC116614139 [Nematostella vectensis]
MQCTLGLLLFFVAFVDLVSGNRHCHGFNGIRIEGYALLYHVIQKVQVPNDLACITRCKATISCFSTNIHFGPGGVVSCELNRKTRDLKPRDFKERTGYEYYEITDSSCCSPPCFETKALQDDWYRFGETMFKIFPPKSWTNAKSHCKSLGAELATIASEEENKFLVDTMVLPSRKSTKMPAALYNLDGSETSVVLHNGAEYRDINGTKALFFNGVGAFATVPAVDFRRTSFTISIWMMPLTPPESFACIFADWSWPWQFISRYTKDGFIRFLARSNVDFLSNSLSVKTKSAFSFGSWNHILFSWNRPLKTFEIFINGLPCATHVSQHANVDMKENDHTVYDLGLKRDSNNEFVHGYMRNLTVYRHVVDTQDIHNSAWIGLNDLTNEGTAEWDNGKPLTYSSLEPTANSPEADCAYMTSLPGGAKPVWYMKLCEADMPFICQKNNVP